MNTAGSLGQVWDPTLPGAGAFRATAIVQLYFRMTGHHPLTILVADALCLVFGANGATVAELVNYLGIAEDRILYGMEGIPQEMRCTARQLASEGMREDDEGREDDADDLPNVRRLSEKETRYFLNYKRLLPLVYAHLTRLLLHQCVVDVPACSYVESVQQAQLAAYQSVDKTTAHAFFASRMPQGSSRSQNGHAEGGEPRRTTGDHIEISDHMRRCNAIRGVLCLGCSSYFLVEEFRDTLSRCPQCGKDVLQLCLRAVRTAMEVRLKQQQQTLATLLPSVKQVWKRMGALRLLPQGSSEAITAAAVLHQQVESTPAQSHITAGESLVTQLDCTLSHDPFLFQQAVVFSFLYNTKFASVNDAANVVDVSEILTEQEYQQRDRASVADQFRSRHRHAASVHVCLVSQKEVDLAKQEEGRQKLRKRTMLPPWLRHATLSNDLGGSPAGTELSDGAFGDDTGIILNDAGLKLCTVVEEQLSTKRRGGHVDTGGANWTETSEIGTLATASAPAGEKTAGTREEILRAASFIKRHYFDNEFDEVALPLSRIKRMKVEQ